MPDEIKFITRFQSVKSFGVKVAFLNTRFSYLCFGVSLLFVSALLIGRSYKSVNFIPGCLESYA